MESAPPPKETAIDTEDSVLLQPSDAKEWDSDLVSVYGEWV